MTPADKEVAAITRGEVTTLDSKEAATTQHEEGLTQTREATIPCNVSATPYNAENFVKHIRTTDAEKELTGCYGRRQAQF